MNNCRPVSVTLLFSKIYERIMHTRFERFFEQNKSLLEYQFGFSKKLSTSLTLSYLIDAILKGNEEQNVVLGLFLDLKNLR